MINLLELFQWRWFSVWLRNFKVWQKNLMPALLGNFGEPVLILLALGYGLGYFVESMEGVPYLSFLASGILCSGAMQTASFEAQYSAYTRMNVQHTWRGILATPLDIQDIVFGEIFWAATKSFIHVTAVLIVAVLLGAIDSVWSIVALPVLFLAGLTFASMAMVMTALAKNYDFFLYYQTLLLAPMMFLSGIFFPLSKMPELIQSLVWLLPLIHVVELVRPLLLNQALPSIDYILWHLLVIAIYGLVFFTIAFMLLRRRLSQ
ncbi:ABC transporter permease [Thioflexithrix psekupsensis]|uniref:Transport permease protein n=1 Tax=Thioflexithrix psekupsensis TaxID=1570016 RepID=A0A251X853_9GAMM|nr:ABC transporter permease [Thioflexithrix psekupsensis]OUD14238.1 nodulation protein NodJ [Thioflexithrix psekupsensis]